MNEHHNQFDRHHAFWPKKDFSTTTRLELRNHPAFKTYIYRPDHDDLHAELAPPLIPGHRMIMGILTHLEGRRERSSLGGLYSTIEYLGASALSGNDVHRYQAITLQHNLLEQVRYITGDKRLVRPEVNGHELRV